MNSQLDRAKTLKSGRLSLNFDEFQLMNFRVPERKSEVINFLNLAVRTENLRTFVMIKKHETFGALDVAQGQRTFVPNEH